MLFVVREYTPRHKNKKTSNKRKQNKQTKNKKQKKQRFFTPEIYEWAYCLVGFQPSFLAFSFNPTKN